VGYPGAQIAISGNSTISASPTGNHIAVFGGMYNYYNTSTYTLSGTPNWPTAFVSVSSLGLAQIYTANVTFSGSSTGKRYDASTNGVVQTFGSGVTYLPGNASGTTATGGQYA
jgi:hypothetical protein